MKTKLIQQVSLNALSYYKHVFLKSYVHIKFQLLAYYTSMNSFGSSHVFFLLNVTVSNKYLASFVYFLNTLHLFVSDCICVCQCIVSKEFVKCIFEIVLSAT